MPLLSDGSCAPSHMMMASSEDRVSSAFGYVDGDNGMHTGFVVAIHYPTDDGYDSAKIITYDIVAAVSVQGGGKTWLTYRNARWGAGTFGSIADFTRARLNVPKGWVNGAEFTQEMMVQSSYVAFFCENGRSTNPVIVGLLEHPLLFDDSKELGHYWAQTFNGFSIGIDKDGQYSATFTGAILDPETNAYIEAPEATTGTTILMDKEGSILLDNVKGESIKLDKTAKSIVTTARSIKTTVTDKDYANTIKGKVTFLAQGNAVFDGKKIYIGNEGRASRNPLVLGNELKEFVRRLLEAFMAGTPIGQLGAMPVMASATLLGALAQLVPYGTPGSAFLSKKGYVE